ncbi:hypothetical protein LCGC14_0200080 [marine sediment metagenome]|uniref:Citrate transporter-like domain-containing protein n=1 Tax=marine sediment metagenome TaxID=412755 RepID=A0A0F9XLY2_9ZZZZ|nr:hypothetical protein [Halopseudomonas sabulinigri]
MKATVLLPLGVALELFGLLTQLHWFSWGAAAAFALYFLLYFNRLNPYPRWLGIATLAILLASVFLAQPEAELWPKLASSVAYYTSFLGALGLMQLLAQRLPQLRELHKALLSGSKVVLYPRYVLTAGSIGSILNFGMMNLLCGTLTEHLKRYPLTDDQRRAGLRSVMVTTLRGFALVPLLAPTSVTIAIISREMPEQSWSTMVPYGAVAALMMIVVGWRRETRGLLELRDNIGDTTKADGMLQLLFGSLIGLGSIGVLASLTMLTASQSAMVLVPFGVISYLLWRDRSPRTVLEEVTDNMASMHNEMFIFGCAALLGGVLGAVAPLEEIATWLAHEPKYNLLLAVGSLFSTILLAVLGLAPIVSLSLIAGLLAQLALLGVPIMTPAVGLMCGFSLAMIFSPFGPSTLILSRYSGETPFRVAFGWNGRFVLSVMPLLLLLIFFTYWQQS